VKLGAFLTSFFRREDRAAPQPIAVPASAPASRSEAESRAREGIARYESGDLAGAARLLEESLERAHDCAPAHYHLGLIAAQRGDAEDALDRFRLAIHFSPSAAAAHRELARTLQRLGDLEQAEEACARACALDPGDAMNHFAAAGVSKARGDLEGAVPRYEAALRCKPDFTDALCNLGFVLQQLGRGSEALRTFDRALALAPDFAEVIQNQGLVLLDHGDPAGALERFRRAGALRPGEPAVVSAEGHALRDLGRLDEALRAYDAVLARQPDYGDAIRNRSQVLLAMGDFPRGWVEYERRFEASGNALRAFPFPRWAGEAMHEEAVLVHAEQGLGDEIMFASCLPDVLARAPRCVVECNVRLAGLFRRSFPDARVHGGLKSDAHDWLAQHPDIGRQISIGSLPGLLRKGAAEFPAHAGYLAADPGRAAAWKARLAALGSGLKVGISWRGGTHRTRMQLRSIPPAEWRPLLVRPAARFVSLQYGEVGPALAEFEKHCGVTVAHWPEAVANLDETAALIAALDLVITVDNTTAHLAGAIGKPVWVLLHYAPEWRWLARGERMPWYPSARLFRQTGPGGWSTVIPGVGDALDAVPSTSV
jgi:tetratricopeptide (TPR) repeat protein